VGLEEGPAPGASGTERRVAGGGYGTTGRWHDAAAAIQGRLPNGLGSARPGTHISFSYLFKDFSNLFEFKMVKGGLLVLENFQNKYGHVYKCIRNNFPI
jgi:hypothetical protein